MTIATHSVGWGQAKLRGLARVDPDSGELANLLHVVSPDDWIHTMLEPPSLLPAAHTSLSFAGNS